VKVKYLSLIALASVAACAAPGASTDGSEAVGSSSADLTVTQSTQQAAATAAINVAIAYENGKLANQGDANYAHFDDLIWSAQEYAVVTAPNGTQEIQFDPNAPGYKYVPTMAMAMLEAAQDNPNVAAYLVGGLQSCFTGTSGAWVYSFRAGVLKGYSNNTTTTGSVPGVIVPTYMYQPSGYNSLSVVDTYKTVGLQSGQTAFTSTLTSTVSPSSARDFWFGMLTYTDLAQYASNTSAVAAKFNSQAQAAACSPFNGAGTGGNPYFTITLTVNNSTQPLPARFQGVGQQCYSTCVSTLTVDPDPYATPGPYYNAAGLVGPSINPFAYDYQQTSATIDHGGQYANGPDANGNPLSGTFSLPVTHKGMITNYSFSAL
jgi:hypothetical protein